MSQLVIYHTGCPDGLAAAAIAYDRWGDQAEYLPAHYHQPPPDVTGRDVLIVDFSYPRETLLAMHAAAASLKVLDHHKSARDALAELLFCEFDMERSGATMMWDYLSEWHGTPTFSRLLAEYVEDRDLWRWRMPGSRSISAALAAFPRDVAKYHALAIGFDDAFADHCDDGTAILRYRERLVEDMAERVRMLDVAGHTVPVVNATAEFSDLGDLLCRRFPEAQFATYYFDRADGVRQWGARSRNGFDVSKIAEQFGGGGHVGAAGWEEVRA